ncbi:branched-chain amino acid ABC transporter permease [Bacillus thermotolerans]|uniref:branched-chain amino acid ABC transporter permease n=1 Tax=Bacillus thermotolerans TaxID=1221996 RepID=UPI0005802C38|nr:branched-chain amino acid ABC transporter permease [Bacillus thermotolerans]KKB34070.1 Branched-chain amino acid transport system permease protein LivM [Bacillus thermotolerans]KKB41491.1 Branched-chain amino acid transport system permease protein LivM [Bacillus thermotolerans]
MRNTYVQFLVSFVALAAAPFVLSLFHLNLLSEILILAIFALSLNVLVGFTGLVSLGHAAFFGVGAYTAAVVAQNVSADMFVTLGLAVAGSFLLAAVIGMFCIKVSGFYFLMLTLAFSQMIYSFIHQSTNLTGGSNGLSGIPRPEMGSFIFGNPVLIFYLVLAVFFVSYAVLRMIVKSPYGQVLVGIRENETRVKSMGYNTGFYKYSAFILAGIFGGVSGALYTYFNGFIAPSDVYWTMSGTALIMVLVGGAGTMLGPVLGAALIVVLETIVSSYVDQWMLVLGLVFITFVVFFPKGIVGIGQSLYKNAVKKKPVYEKKKSRAA